MLRLLFQKVVAREPEVVLPDRKQLSGLLEWQAVRIPAEVLALSPEDLKWRRLARTSAVTPDKQLCHDVYTCVYDQKQLF